MFGGSTVWIWHWADTSGRNSNSEEGKGQNVQLYAYSRKIIRFKLMEQTRMPNNGIALCPIMYACNCRFSLLLYNYATELSYLFWAILMQIFAISSHDVCHFKMFDIIGVFHSNWCDSSVDAMQHLGVYSKSKHWILMCDIWYGTHTHKPPASIYATKRKLIVR